MKIFMRFLLGIYCVCIAILSLVLFLVGINVISFNVLEQYSNLMNNVQYQAALIATGILFFLISLRLLFSGYSGPKDKSAIEKSSQLGKILISLRSIESIVMATAKQIDGVMDVKINLSNEKDSVSINLEAVVTPEKSFPELSANVQSRIKEVVERITGVNVLSVQVYIQDVIQTIRPRVKPIEE